MKERKRTVKFTLRTKLDILQEAEQCSNIRATARKYKIYPQQIRQWRRDKSKFQSAIKRNPNVKTIHQGKPVQNIDVEQQLLIWIKDLHSKEITISTRHIITKALSIDSTFHNGNTNALWSWVYVFLQRNNLNIRRLTKGEKLSEHSKQDHQDVVDDTNNHFCINATLTDGSNPMIGNIDEGVQVQTIQIQEKIEKDLIHETV